MQQHLLNQHLVGVLHAQPDHGQAVADENHVHARRVGDVRAGEVVRRDHRDRLTPLVHLAQQGDGDLLARRRGGGAHGRVGAPSGLLVGLLWEG